MYCIFIKRIYFFRPIDLVPSNLLNLYFRICEWLTWKELDPIDRQLALLPTQLNQALLPSQCRLHQDRIWSFHQDIESLRSLHQHCTNEIFYLHLLHTITQWLFRPIKHRRSAPERDKKYGAACKHLIFSHLLLLNRCCINF